MSAHGCAFCGASAQLVATPLLDEKWSRRFGGEPALVLDHGWFRAPSGDRVPVDLPTQGKYFHPAVRAACDYCVHGWMEDVRWRAEPALLGLAERRPLAPSVSVDLRAAVRWTHLTALLAELVPGLPGAAQFAQRHALRLDRDLDPAPASWLFTLPQRLPARVHLSQVEVAGSGSLLQVVSVDLAHLVALVVLPADRPAAEALAAAPLPVELGPPAGYEPQPRQVDLSRTPHPHRIAVHRLCSVAGGD